MSSGGHRASSRGSCRASSGRHRAPSGGSSRTSSGAIIWIRNGPCLLNVPEKASDRAKGCGDGARQVIEVIWNCGHYCKVRTKFDVNYVVEISQEGGGSEAKIAGEGDPNGTRWVGSPDDAHTQDLRWGGKQGIDIGSCRNPRHHHLSRQSGKGRACRCVAHKDVCRTSRRGMSERDRSVQPSVLHDCLATRRSSEKKEEGKQRSHDLAVHDQSVIFRYCEIGKWSFLPCERNATRSEPMRSQVTPFSRRDFASCSV